LEVNAAASVGGKVVWRVEIDRWTAHLVSLQHSEWGCIYVNGYEVLSADIRVAQLMDIRNTRDVKRVMRGGRIFTVNELIKR